MTRSLFQRISLAALAAALAVGCASGTPKRQGAGGGGAPGTTSASTTGDADACAIALGNTDTNLGTTSPGAQPEPTANGILIGNVALVALPSNDNLPITGTTRGPAGAATPAPLGHGGAAETTGSTGMTHTGTTAAPGTSPSPATPVPGTTTAPAGNGPAGVGTPGAGGGGAANPTALDRIRTACTKVTQIRVVTDSADRARLATIAMSVRKGTPVTDFIDDLARMSKKATTMGAGAGATFQPGEGPTTTAPTGAGGGGTATPGAGAYGTPPGQMGPGTTPAPNR
jgi:hypothetical protein